MVHAAMAAAQPGDVLVLTMPEPAPVALIGDLLATQAKGRGVVAVLVDAAVRDVEDLRELGHAGVGALGARAWRRQGRPSATIDEPVSVGGMEIRAGRRRGARRRRRGVVPAERADEVLEASHRARGEGARQARAAAGRRAVVGDRRAAGALRVSEIAHLGPVELLTPEGRGEPGVLRRRARHGGRGARRRRRSTSAAGATTSASRSSSPSPSTSGMAVPRPARVEPGGARAPRRRRRGRGPRRGMDRRRPRPRPVLPVPRPRRPRLRAVLRGRALRAARAPAGRR